ncbi:MAG TPA: L-histidine N(alpha)-methyltransferase [Bryobacteraceae bacterium]|nr:L-histidine N(alpha)-methyltransferase [Bryobacteraceae bacterium]
MTAPAFANEFAMDVRAGLAEREQKSLPPKYFYDDLGSALFEAITLLPEYGLTRADERIVQRCSRDLPLRFRSDVTVAELGSGSGRKTRRILEAFHTHQPLVDYYAIDVSRSALEACRRELSPVARVSPLECSYLQGVRHLADQRRADRNLLVLFLGSAIGNFGKVDALVFLRDLRAHLKPGDALLLGADLVKPCSVLLPAYDDAAGVTAAFNMNLLLRMNRELGASFNPRSFCHLAIWDERESAIEMHLCSLAEQMVTIPGAGCTATFREGETIWTESSHKYSLEGLREMAASAGFRIDGEWTDAEWPFVEALWLVE